MSDVTHQSPLGEATREPTHPTESLPPPADQQGQDIHFGKVIAVGIVSLAIFAVGSIWSISILHTKQKEMNPSGRVSLPAEIGQEEIGIVDQVPFDLNRWVHKYKQEQNQRLDSYGWVDRKAEKIHLPIERAMDLMVQEQKK
ncbi:MAG: hypothetical protein NVS4B10_07290 [Myxococcales bacterium]